MALTYSDLRNKGLSCFFFLCSAFFSLRKFDSLLVIRIFEEDY